MSKEKEIAVATPRKGGPIEAKVAKVIGPRELIINKGSRDGVKQLVSEPGTLAFFRGRYSLHRVPAVEGSTPRMNSVLTYSVERGHKLNALAQQLYYGRTA